ncbi:MAG: 6-phosphogluconolactonase [Psittacicella sp.]
MNSIIFKTVQNLMEKIAQELISYSQESEGIHIAISGGNTPKALFKLLTEEKYNSGKHQIKWNNIHFWWCDERLVKPENSDSNYGEAKRILFDNISIPKENIHRIIGEAIDHKAEALRYEQEISVKVEKQNSIPCFDWIMLGMGSDGHTASLFPEANNLDSQSLALVVQNPYNSQFRISMSAKLLSNAKRITFIVTGDDKASTVKEINSSKTSYPAGNISSKKGITEWFLDGAAGQLIK